MRSKSFFHDLITPTRIAGIGMTILLVGITLTSMSFGALSAPYFMVALFGLALAVPFTLKYLYKNLPVLALLMFSPLFLTILQYVFLEQYSFIPPSFLSSVGMGAVLFAAVVVGSLPVNEFRRVMTYAAIAHAGICGYGIVFWDFSSAVYGGANRFGTEEMGTAVWAELAVGTAIAALLSGRRWLLWLVVPIVVLVIYSTQMRGAGLALVISFFMYWFLIAGRNWNPLLLFSGFCLMLAGALIMSTELGSAISTALLINDQHRGLSSGFSGRLENWALAWERFLSSPIIGVGQSDRIASNAHNGILKIFAEYGLVFSMTMLAFVFLGLRNALRMRMYDIFAAIVGLILFIGPAPRYINFQIMPFVSLAAVAFALYHSRRILVPSRDPLFASTIKLGRHA